MRIPYLNNSRRLEQCTIIFAYKEKFIRSITLIHFALLISSPPYHFALIQANAKSSHLVETRHLPDAFPLLPQLILGTAHVHVIFSDGDICSPT